MNPPGTPVSPAPAVILYTSQFPTPTAPGRCVFTLRLAGALRRRRATSVICPLPYVPDLARFRREPERRGLIGVSGHHSLDGVSVNYLRHLSIPGLSRPYTARIQALRARGDVRRTARRQRTAVINAHWVYPDGVAAVHMARKLGLPVVLTALGCDINDYPSLPGVGAQIRRALGEADAVTGVSQELADKMVELGVPAERSFFIPNGVDRNVFRWNAQRREDARRARGLAPGERYVGFIGRLEHEKGPDVLVQALRELQAAGKLNFHCLFLGAGSMMGALEAEIAGLGLSQRVTFAGAQSPDSIPDWMQALDLLCLASRREGMPNVVLEAISAGLPVVASAVGAVPSLVTSGAGTMVQPGNASALAAALHEAAAREWPRAELSQNCAHPSWEQVAERYLELFDSVSAARHRNGN